MNKTSQWAGYLASFFAITFFVASVSIRSDIDSRPAWQAAGTGWCMILAAISGVICLVSAIFNFARRRTMRDKRISDDHTMGTT